MSEHPYSNRELDLHFEEIKGILGRIEGQTTRTNGRVSSLEKWRTGIIMCVAFSGVVLLPLLSYTYKISQQNLQNQILTKVTTQIATQTK